MCDLFSGIWLKCKSKCQWKFNKSSTQLWRLLNYKCTGSAVSVIFKKKEKLTWTPTRRMNNPFRSNAVDKQPKDCESEQTSRERCRGGNSPSPKTERRHRWQHSHRLVAEAGNQTPQRLTTRQHSSEPWQKPRHLSGKSRQTSFIQLGIHSFSGLTH